MKSLGAALPQVLEQAKRPARVPNAAEQAVVIAGRQALTSLPDSLAWHQRWIGSSVTIEGRGTFPVLPAGVAKLTDDERALLERRADELRMLMEPEAFEVVVEVRQADGPKKVTATSEQAKFMHIRSLLLSLASAALTEDQVRERGHAYLYALRDKPAWATLAAIEAWWDGKVKGVDEDKLTWAPSPALLTRVVDDQLVPFSQAHRDVDILLRAKHYDEIVHAKD